jgi:hypothetical protein
LFIVTISLKQNIVRYNILNLTCIGQIGRPFLVGCPRMVRRN